MELNELLPYLVGVIMSLVFSYLPKVSEWYATSNKRLVMLASLAVVSLVYFGLSCTAFAAQLGILVSCDQAGAFLLVQAFAQSVIASQAAYLLTPDKVAG